MPYPLVLRLELWCIAGRTAVAVEQGGVSYGSVAAAAAIPSWWTAGAVRDIWTASCRATAVCWHHIPPDGTATVPDAGRCRRRRRHPVVDARWRRPLLRRCTPTAVVRRRHRRRGSVGGGYRAGPSRRCSSGRTECRH